VPQELQESRLLSRHLLLALAGFALTFCAGDGALSRVSLPHVTGSTNECRWKWELYEGRQQTPDVVFLGASYVYYGVAPKMVDAEVARLSTERITSLNLASPSATTVTQLMLVRRILSATDRPRLIYLSISPIAVDLRQREGLENSIRALGTFRELPIALRSNPTIAREAVLSAAFSSYHQWRDCRLLAQRTMEGAPAIIAVGMKLDERGWAAWTGGTDSNRRATLASSVLPQIEADRFADSTPNAVALREAIRLLRASDVPFRLLEMPLSTTAPPEAHPDLNVPYRALVDRVANEFDLQLVRCPEGIVADDDFFDGKHVNPSGAKRLSLWLAKDVAGNLPGR
jgi:hypothetical protein